MKLFITLENVQPEDLPLVGGKAFSLAHLARHGFHIARTLCITTGAYETYINEARLRERILLELNRKDAREMRWEEIWDSALRIRNMFLQTPIPSSLRLTLQEAIAENFADVAVVVRSSAPSEDAAGTSFAGLHESYVNVRGVDAILEHIKLVWASLWSDAAISYRQELGLDVHTSTMAVVIQEIINGERSGVAFSQSPTDASQVVIEAVYGLNQGLVDGTVEPDRWMLKRTSHHIMSHTAAQRTHRMLPGPQGVQLHPLPPEFAQQPPLKEDEVLRVCSLVQQAEQVYGTPQDVEWTFKDHTLYTLQSRPITTISRPTPQDDRRQWDLSLRRSYANLQILRRKIEEQHLPAMIAEADALAQAGFTNLSDQGIAREIRRRADILQSWVDIYWADFIPFAHGIRLFGQVYNDAVRPDDPYEFVQLLQAANLQSVERNRLLAELASMVRADETLARQLREGDVSNVKAEFARKMDQFLTKFGDLAYQSLRRTQTTQEHTMLIKIVLNMAAAPLIQPRTDSITTGELKECYLAAFEPGEPRQQALDMLELGRVSYQLRDDDNIYLGRIEDQLHRAAHEGRLRLQKRGIQDVESLPPEEISKALENADYRPQVSREFPSEPEQSAFILKGRQLVGQPAGPGFAQGTARLILSASDLAQFQHGEILVCDAIDPTMTFIVPLAVGVVERRGGMLIHGAIIAREYGLPCVTGVPDVTRMIHPGDYITVDGYLGIVTVGTPQGAFSQV